MSVLIITLNYNQNDYTIKCIQSVLESNYSDFKILLIDNGSTPENLSQLEAALPSDDRLIFMKITANRGYVGGINFGLSEGIKFDPDYFMIMNNDVVLENTAVEALTKACLKHNNKAIVTGKVYFFDEPDKIQNIGSNYSRKNRLEFERFGRTEKDVGQYDDEAERDMLDDVFWLFHKNLYEEIGGYSTYFWFNSEQADFALRARAINYKLIYTPTAKLWHKGSASIGGRNFNPALAYWNMQSSLILKYIHLSKKDFFVCYIHSWISVIRTFIKSIFQLFSKVNRLNYAYAKLKGLTYVNSWIFSKKQNDGRNPFIKN
jgi:GT2 family glycosyltransferase